jgi:hypothetical protein
VCKNEIATNQSPTVTATVIPEDIEVGKDEPRLAALSSEIPRGRSAFGAQRSAFGVRWSFRALLRLSPDPSRSPIELVLDL